MHAEPTTTDKMAALYVTERLKGQALEGLNDAVANAARTVISCWEKGDLAAAVNLLREALEELDDHHDEVAVIQAGWERKDNAWVRFTVQGETLDPEIAPSLIWIADGMIYALMAEDALTQDEFRDLPRA